MKKHDHGLSLCFFLSNFFLASQIWAFDCDFDGAGSWYVTAGGGRTEPFSTDSDNFVGTGPNWPDDHYIANNTHGSALGLIGGGYSWSNRYSDWLPAVSLGGQFSFTTLSQISGVIDQYSSAEFENYTYSYQFRRYTLLGVGKADIYRFGYLMPYVTGGLGVSFNSTSNYSEQPLANVTPRISPGFRSTTNAYFSYMVGLGVDFIACNYLWLSVEYNYGSYGFAQTGNGVHTPSLADLDYSNQSIKNRLRANNFIFSVTYLLNV